MPSNASPLLHGSMQVFYRPELSIFRVRFWAKQLAWRVFSQPLADCLDLNGPQFGAVPSDSLVRIGRNGQELVMKFTWENIAKDLNEKYLDSISG